MYRLPSKATSTKTVTQHLEITWSDGKSEAAGCIDSGNPLS